MLCSQMSDSRQRAFRSALVSFSGAGVRTKGCWSIQPKSCLSCASTASTLCTKKRMPPCSRDLPAQTFRGLVRREIGFGGVSYHENLFPPSGLLVGLCEMGRHDLLMVDCCIPQKSYAPCVSAQLRILAGKETEGFSPNAEATFTSRSVRRGSPNSAAPNVSTAHSSTFCCLCSLDLLLCLLMLPYFLTSDFCISVSAIDWFVAEIKDLPEVKRK